MSGRFSAGVSRQKECQWKSFLKSLEWTSSKKKINKVFLAEIFVEILEKNNTQTSFWKNVQMLCWNTSLRNLKKWNSLKLLKEFQNSKRIYGEKFSEELQDLQQCSGQLPKSLLKGLSQLFWCFFFRGIFRKKLRRNFCKNCP